MKIILKSIGILFSICTLTQSINYSNTSISNRKAKDGGIWPLTVVRFENSLCTTSDGFEGICYGRRQCRINNGISAGTCAGGLGRCCWFQRSCGSTSSWNNTYFVNSGYPNGVTTGSQCTYTIKKCSPDICQVRIDFLSLDLAQPDGQGFCRTDALNIIGGANPVPTICGINSGQHVYVYFNNNDDIKISITTSSNFTCPRNWNIKVSQIGCACPSLAPTGCLQYYADVSGTVESFNYGTTASTDLIPMMRDMMTIMLPGTRQLANTNYGVCVQMQPGYCSIEWSPGPDPTSFTVSGDTYFYETDIGGSSLPNEPLMNGDCTSDFIVVPNPTTPDGTPISTDRFCGSQLDPIRSSSKPFVMTVVTDGTEGDVESGNRGFSLMYTQIPCSSDMNVINNQG